ncbi:DUF4326 domain-containing protein [Streptomyces sp. NPDC046853]|uniref:DUF4326 domain-containing protein n=1 Tax=Streptomyces sp. NPDC046853 TaxID=3154920 RepID=UPI0033C6EBC5
MTAPTRIRRMRTKGWSLAGAADLFRGGMIVDRSSRFGNPCTVASMAELGYVDPHAAAAANFRFWLAGSRSDAPTDEADRRRDRILSDLHLLRGKDLACTCRYDQACHGDELLRRANMPADELRQWITVVRARVDRQRIRAGEKPLHPEPQAVQR